MSPATGTKVTFVCERMTSTDGGLADARNPFTLLCSADEGKRSMRLRKCVVGSLGCGASRYLTALAMLFTMTMRAPADDTAAQIQVTATHRIRLDPQKLRLTMSIRAEGVDTKEAVTQLTVHKERVRAELAELKADETSLTFTAPALASAMAGMPPQAGSREMRRILRNMGNDAGEGLAKLPSLFAATAMLQVDWAVPTTNVDALTLLPLQLKEQLAARDFAGERNRVQLTATQQEQVDELKVIMADEMGFDFAEDEDETGAQILFVARPTAEQREGALRAALTSAREQAESLAQAANLKLGAIRQMRLVTEEPSSTGDMARLRGMLGGYGEAVRVDMPPSSPEDVTDPRADGLYWTIRIQVEFFVE